MGESLYAVAAYFDGVPVQHMADRDRHLRDCRRIAIKAKAKRGLADRRHGVR